MSAPSPDQVSTDSVVVSAISPAIRSERGPKDPRVEALAEHPLFLGHAENFRRLIRSVPDAEKYLKRVEHAVTLAVKNEALAAAHIGGVLFELSRIAKVSQQGLETILFGSEATEAVHYDGYVSGETDFSVKRRKPKQSKVSSDVPIVRAVLDENGNEILKPYIYEAKAYPRMAYGASADSRNQILKYQKAVESGIAAGATIEIKGRIDPTFLKWLMGESIVERGAAPDVEVIYALELPSGAEYRFVLNGGRQQQGLKFLNEHEAYSAEDQEVVSGIFRAIVDHSVIGILAGNDVDSPSEALQPLLADPYNLITTRALFDEYAQGRNKAMHAAFRRKGRENVINSRNERSAAEIITYGEAEQRVAIAHIFDAFQASLQHDPELVGMRDRYAIEDEETRQMVIEETLEMVGKVGNFERSRTESGYGETDRPGYRGKPEGVALAVDSIVFDAVYIVLKRKIGESTRTYGRPERFQLVTMDNVMEYLQTQDRVYTTCEIYDPVLEQTENFVSDGTVDANKRIEKRKAKFQKDNEQRLVIAFQETVAANTARLAVLEAQAEKSLAETKELHALEGEKATILRQIDNLESSILRRKNSLKALNDQRIGMEAALRQAVGEEKVRLSGGLTQLISELRIRSEESRLSTARDRKKIQELYVQVIGPKEWKKKEIRVVEENTRNILKFIYIVSCDGEVRLCEEVVKGNSKVRSTHSEVAAGRNVYGAGELVFEKIGGQWRAIEVNNGSGHYKPSRLTLPYVAHLLGQKIDLSHCAQRDVLLRGVATPEFSAALQ